MLPFAGLSVPNLSQGIAGPVRAAIRARQGADVTKIEPRRPPADNSTCRTCRRLDAT